jgi:hypothetical protein
MEAVLEASMKANGYPSDTTVDIVYPDSSSITVNTSFPAKKYFSGAVFDGAITIRARATIAAGTSSSNVSACLLALNTTKAGALTMTGNSNVNIKGCVAASNSSSSSAINLGGSTSLAAQCLYTAGGISNPSKAITGCASQSTNQPAIADPMASIERPTGTGCKGLPAAQKKGKTVYSAGCYNSNTDLKGEIEFSPGVYILNNTTLKINANATITGTGVTFVLQGSSTLNFNGTATIQLSATSDATSRYKGILFLGDSSGARSHSINGGAASSLEGTVYLPRDNISFSGNSGLGKGCLRLISDTIDITGNSKFSSDCSAEEGASPQSSAVSLRIID